ncbi:hypothetical protein [Rhodocaloribacter sp.]
MIRTEAVPQTERSRRFPVALTMALGLMLGLAVDAGAQAWTMPSGEAYVKVFYGKVTAAEQFTFDGRRTDFIDGMPGDTFRDRSLYVYGEVGLSDRVTFVFSLPYKRIFIRDHAFRFRTYAFGTAELGARVSLLPFFGVEPSRNALAVNLGFGLPTGYTRNYAPSVDAGQVNVQAMLSYGRSFYPFPAYAQVGIGYRLRSTLYVFSGATPCRAGRDVNCIVDPRPDYGDELVYRFEAGLTPFGGGLLLQALAGGNWSWKEPVVGFSALNPIPTRQRFVKVGGGATVYPFRLAGLASSSSMGVSVQVFFTPYGRNALRTRDLFVGLEYRLRFR